MIKKRRDCANARDGKKPMLVAISSVIAAVAGLLPMVVHSLVGDSGSRVGANPDVAYWASATAGFYAPNASRVAVRLSQGWRFRTGDDPTWSQPALVEDRDWSAMEVDGAWEDQGFAGYDGLAWYRNRFKVPTDLAAGSLFLRLGRIDDADEVWVNGTRIGGTGEMKPGGRSAWMSERVYPLPRTLLRLGAENVVAVRVFDGEQRGGLFDGVPAILVQDLPEPLVDLERTWKLSPDNQAGWRLPEADETTFDDVLVPGIWENQGRGHFDGDLWYRVHFTLAPRAGEALVLCLGVIDDEDQVFLNGEKIGETVARERSDHVWEAERAYTFSGDKLRAGEGANVLAVRVHDVEGPGGFVRGPVGIMTAADHARWSAGRDDSSGAWVRAWNWLLGRD